VTDLSQPTSEQAPVEAPGQGAAPVASASHEAAENKSAQNKSAKEDANDFPFAIALGEIYEGPLDLLLDLIRKQDINIYDIPIARITAQYLTYVERIRELDVNIASEFIYMAAVLIHIKSKMLLPRDPLAAADALEDPRNELVNRLLEHEKFKSAAQMLLQKQQIDGRRGHRARTGRRCDRLGQDFPANTGPGAHPAHPGSG
jgi:segregation and condensation protein A